MPISSLFSKGVGAFWVPLLCCGGRTPAPLCVESVVVQPKREAFGFPSIMFVAAPSNLNIQNG